jgi:DNA modification methylase
MPPASEVERQTVSITAAKGRPMLTWVGKRPLEQVTAFPAQEIETFSPPNRFGIGGKDWKNWPAEYPESGLVFHGDNKEVLAHLLAHGFRGKVNLIYIDPPFDSGADYIRRVKLRGVAGTAKVEGEEYTLGEQIQYTDIWANDNYLQFMYERFLLLKELLADDGNLFVQADDKRGHYLKLLLDEVMGPDNYVNDIVWHKGREGGGGTEVNPPLPTEYQNIYLYAKDRKNRKWHPPRGPYRISTLQSLEKDEKGWFYTRGRMGRKPALWEIQTGAAKKTYVSNDPNEPKDALIKRLTSPGAEHVLIGDVWNAELVRSSTETDYPTEKPESLLRLIIAASTDPGDVVLDCFVGSGTTAAVAQKLGRRWIACDINRGAIQTTSKRLQSIILEQIREEEERTARPVLPGANDNTIRPAQLSFAVYRVNDYDLQMQYDEAVNLACEHIGITRMRTDSFFDGVLGKRLVKIAPFNHPLSPLDLEEVKKVLNARPEEERDILIVCLGKELAVDAWLEDWNQLRKKGDVPNAIEVIELRTDPKYGKFFVHKTARAKVNVKRVKDRIEIEIEDFISPTIIERLKQQSGIVTPQIDDWRAMVDAVMIDTSYDGKVFNIAVSDVPKQKSDLVAGKYDIPYPPKSKTMVAVKIVDMLGEEVLVMKAV